ncbi:hypothetical protein DYU11_10095 [Fibrisoma montanum]|uniref:Uncharacterized protein n=1 Tax=Fibrisoma montanum TaxID=2305895 RepID=A0A418MAE8_9BACT|nr:outer membrane beta-barrel protein [Fibrisoma montanum]RIV23348.1 hypothetical protein DYU11_10095 [Fibrisoma montanum]
MKLIIRSFLLGLAGLLSGHSVVGQGKLSLSLSASPTFQYSKTEQTVLVPITTNGQPVTAQPVDFRAERTGWGYSVGLLARYNLTARFSFSTGILLNRVRYNVPTISTNPANVPFTLIATSQRNYQIPVTINYLTSGKRLSPYVSAGGLFALPSVTIFENGEKSKFPNQDIHIHPMLAAGLAYRLSNQLSVIAQPTFAYILPQQSFSRYQNYQVGLQAQVLYTVR